MTAERLVPYHHSMAWSKDLNVFGRPLRNVCMLLRASIAVPDHRNGHRSDLFIQFRSLRYLCTWRAHAHSIPCLSDVSTTLLFSVKNHLYATAFQYIFTTQLLFGFKARLISFPFFLNNILLTATLMSIAACCGMNERWALLSLFLN